MTIDFSEESATRAVIDSFGNCGDDRLTAVLAGVVRHLHGLVREIEPSQHEWDRGIQFLTEAGRLSDGRRNELVLLSDVLGASDARRRDQQPENPGHHCVRRARAPSTSIARPRASWEPISR